MPFTPAITYADGNPITWADIEANLSAMRTWINAIPASDVVAAGLTRDALVRPRVAGWPTQGLFGDPQVLAWDSYGALAGPMNGRDAWGQQTERLTLMPGASSTASDRQLTKFGRSLYLHDLWTHHVQIHVTGSIKVRTTELTVYPDGAGGPVGGARGGVGYLQMYRLDRTAGTETAYATGRAKVYPQNTYTTAGAIYGYDPYSNDRFHVVYYEALSGGKTYDFVLGYSPENTDKLVQVDLSELTMTVEVA